MLNNTVALQSPLRINPNLQNLIDALILGQIKSILISNVFGQEPTTDKMPAPIKRHTRLGRRQADQRMWHKLRARSFLRRSALDIP